MCGIAGILHYNKYHNIETLFECLSKRGPDYQGIYIDDDIILIHTRLALVGSLNQPLQNEKYVLVANAEIYNYKELSLKLNIKTDSDCEVLLEGLTQHGILFLNEVDGDFAFALWDKIQKKLILCKDRFGIRQVYYKQDDSFYFASTITALNKISPSTISRKNIFYSLRFRTCEIPETCYTGVYSLQPGCYYDGQVKKWYELPNFEIKISRQEAREYLLFLLRNSIDLRTNIKCGLALSSGVDSTLIAENGQIPYAFTLNNHEKEQAEMTAKWENMWYKEVDINIDELDQTLPLFEKPYYSISLTYFLAKAMNKEGIKVFISGLGPDEALGGYWYYKDPYGVEMYKKAHTVFSHYELQLMFNEEYEDKEFNAPVEDSYKQMNYLDITHYLPAHHFPYNDKMLMNFGIEGRYPYLDHKVFEFMYSLPKELKINKNILSLQGNSKFGLSIDMDNLMQTELKDWSNDMISELKSKNFINIPKDLNYKQKYFLCTLNKML